ncbi:MAG: T9SS type A sorting domain-containing protein [Ignavibacteriales bacterium]|nr:T9SS type A sorting domain-containing protein [Ignavibacteriales bacterium]
MITKRLNINKVLFTSLILTLSVTAQTTWESTRVFFENDKLKYTSDAEGNKIPDFSYAGYKNSEVEIPFVQSVLTISPIVGDNTLHIQTALNQVAALPPNSDGFRGALYMEPGIYNVYGTIRLNISGVVIRGAGDGDDSTSNTIIVGRENNPAQRSIIIAGGGGTSKWFDQVSGTNKNIISDTVFVGDKEFYVEDSSPYSVGDNIIIFHPSTDSWLLSIQYGGTHYTESGAEVGVDLPWVPGQENIVYNRYITAIDANKITIDAPVFNTLFRSLSQSYIYKYARSGIVTNIGVENLRIDIETAGGLDENHAWQAIDMYQIEDAWVRNCTMLHFGQSAVRTNTATRITIDSCNALDPISTIEGERRYNFNVYTASQLILFKNCSATNGRHHYVSNGYSYTSGCVFLDCTSSGAYTSSEGHRRWSQGLLYDNVVDLNGPRAGLNARLLGLYNRGYYGTSHGWSVAHSVAWNCDVANGDLIVQKPPTAQNYAIGCSGARITGQYPPAPFNDPQGFIEGSNQLGLNPRSLFLAQLEDRLSATSVENFNYNKNDGSQYSLFQNYPNPFNPETTISFSILNEEKISISIQNILGEKIAQLVDEVKPKGLYSINFNGQNLSSGVYFISLEAIQFHQTKKMILIK